MATKKEYDCIINDEGEVLINGHIIDEEIFSKEKVDYKLQEREEAIDNLIMWISETKNHNDKELMKEDLKYLMSLEDTFVFSSISSNYFISKSKDRDRFNGICEEILGLNRTFEKDTDTKINELKKICLESWNNIRDVGDAVRDLNNKHCCKNAWRLGQMQGFRISLSLFSDREFKDDPDFLNFVTNKNER